MNQANRSASEKLSDRLEADILSRGFKVGDPYMTADEAGEFLGVSRATAHRAFESLIKKGLIVSKRKMGTVIGPAYASPSWETERHIVKVLISIERLKEGLSYDDIVEGINAAIPVVELSILYIPVEKPLEFVEKCVVENERSNLKTSYLLVGCPRVVQEFFGRSQYNSVVLGALYPLAQKLPCVSINNFEKGYTIAKLLTELGHRKVAFLFNENWLPAYSHMLKGANRAMSEVGCLQGSIELASLPQDEDSIRFEIQQFFMLEEPPTAVICTKNSVEAVIDEVKKSEMGLRSVDDSHGVSVVVHSTVSNDEGPSKLYHQNIAEVDFKERVIAAAKKLMMLSDHGKLEQAQDFFQIKMI